MPPPGATARQDCGRGLQRAAPDGRRSGFHGIIQRLPGSTGTIAIVAVGCNPLDSPRLPGDHILPENRTRTHPVDHHSFRAQLVFSIGFALSRSRDLLRRLLREHAPDDARRELAERVVKGLEGSGFEVDEQARALRQRPSTTPHSTPD
jgi:hypothetical protein